MLTNLITAFVVTLNFYILPVNFPFLNHEGITHSPKAISWSRYPFFYKIKCLQKIDAIPDTLVHVILKYGLVHTIGKLLFIF